MAIVYRTVGAWGAGKGGNLDAAEIDNNFYELAQDIVALGAGPQPAEIDTITVTGDQMTITLSDLTVFGPYTIPRSTFVWRGDWVASTAYATNEIVRVSRKIYLVAYDHTSELTFDPDYQPSGEVQAAYILMADASLIGAVDDLTDVTLSSGGPADGAVLRYDATSGVTAWVDSTVPAALDDLTDVTLSSGGPADGDFLRYDATSGVTAWVNEPFVASVAVEDDGASIVAAATTLDFTGGAVTVTATGSGQATVNIPTPDLTDLGDVTITTPTDGQVMVYDSVTSTWQNDTIPSAVLGIDDLTDVALTSGGPADGDLLVYDGSSGVAKWVNQAAGTGSIGVEDDGASIVASATTLDFTGSGVTVTDTGAGQATVNIPGGTSLGAKVYRATALTTIDASAGYSIPFVTEEYDDGTWHDNSTNNTRLTVPSGVTHVDIAAKVRLDLVTANTETSLRIRKNGSNMTPDYIDLGYVYSSLVVMGIVAQRVPVTSGDYFEMYITSGADTSISVSIGTHFSIRSVS